MGWDSSRPVPWQRLVREWLIYAAIMTAIFVIFFRNDNWIGAIAGVLISGPLYLAFGAVLAKFGYQRQRFKDIRAESRTKAAATDDDVDAPTAGRPKPPPTSRTAGGGNRPRASGKRKR